MNAGWSAAAYWLVDVHVMATIVLAAALLTLWRIEQPARRMAVMRWTLLVLLGVPWLALMARTSGVVRLVSGLEELCYCGTVEGSDRGRMADLAAIYAIGSGLVAAWLGLGAVVSARLGIYAAKPPESLQGILDRVVPARSTCPRLRLGKVSQPMALGLFRPTIVLPAWFVESEPEVRVEAALAHEWAHLRRGDLWALAASRVLLVLLFAHPLFHVLRSRLRADQELIADAEAAGATGNLAYAEALVGWARRTSCSPFSAPLGLLGRPSMLRTRVATLLDPGFHVEPVCPRRWTLAVRFSAGALAIGLGVLATTGVGRTAVAGLVGDRPPGAPHTHPAVSLQCPVDSTTPGSLELSALKSIGCESGPK